MALLDWREAVQSWHTRQSQGMLAEEIGNEVLVWSDPLAWGTSLFRFL